ncbi:MAG TPA: hypothetical protein VET85_10730 [Stellaceae bacterium]|nr:hypothetical protein [Stellaceae bacterium]
MPAATRFAAAAFALILGACAAEPPPAQVYADVKTIGVISDIGDRVMLKTMGATALGSLEVIEPVDWGIDQHVVGEVSRRLADRFAVTPLTYDASAFDDIVRLGQPVPAAAIGERPRRPIEDILRTAVTPRGLDAYVVITRAASPYRGGRQVVEGLGLVRSDGAAAPEAFAIYDITVVDGRKYTVIRRARARQENDLVFPPIAGAHREVAAGDWAQSLAAASEPQRRRLRETLLALIDRSLGDTLRMLGLAQ